MRSTNTSFSEKNPKASEETGRIIDPLGDNPDGRRIRTGPQGSSSPIPDQSSTIQQYMREAEGFAKDGLTFESIAVYRKILSLDALTLSKRSLASMNKAEKLLQEVRRLYEKVFESDDRETRNALKTTSRGSEILHHPKTRDESPEEEISESEASEPVPIETLLEPCEDQPATQLPTDEISQGYLSSKEVSPSAGPAGEMGAGVTADDSEALSVANPRQGLQTRVPQIDRAETAQSDSEKDPKPQGSSLGVFPGELEDTGPQDRSDDEDPNFHYHLGVAYHQMEVRDRAIQEFSKSYDRGIKPLECLVMLARCYVEKGLFQDSVNFIHQALKLNNLGQHQIELLHRQIQEIRAKRGLTPSVQMCAAH